MIGEAIILRPDRPVEYRTYTGPVEDGHWSQIVEGLVEVVPHFDHWVNIDGHLRPCIVFCNEEGKIAGLDINFTATAIWQYVMRVKGIKVNQSQHIITGPVVIVFGDDEFLESI